ncbi:protein Wnt-2 isoform X2 [Hermetia illucens]|uniref:protein Wnt-2 isoform X2 n=1 Tax=Hermetia illucens TaxID=343691 RepID=UPI0018CC3929|nr:protein Wnt-2 isoform X2 [Hermetia illucens]
MRKTLSNICMLLVWMLNLRSSLCLTSAVLCSRIPGLSPAQRDLCIESPDALIALASGRFLGVQECQHQFKGHRWNCTEAWQREVFGHVIPVGSREAAFTYAVASAGAVHAITSACARGNISLCGCDRAHRNSHSTRNHHVRHMWPVTNGGSNRPWKWGGCSADIKFGMSFARRFLDAREIEGDARSLMNLHNNRVGRKIVKNLLRTDCKCHGISGSCAMKTCWKSLPPFRVIGSALKKKYNRAKLVQAVKEKTGLSLVTLSKVYFAEQTIIQRTLRNARGRNAWNLYILKSLPTTASET